MKYLFSFVVISFLTSCVVQEQYYGPGYGPGPQVEVQRYYPQSDYYHHNGYRPRRGGRVYQGHGGPRGQNVIVNPRGPQAQVEVQHNVHGHGRNNVNVARHPQQYGATAVAKENGHPDDEDNVIEHAQSNGTQTNSQATHGHR